MEFKNTGVVSCMRSQRFILGTDTPDDQETFVGGCVCVPAGCPVCTDGRRGYVNTSACFGHCVSSFFSPRTCFHSASEYDVGSSLLNFVFWLHNLLDHFCFFFEMFVRCLYWLGFVRPIFLGPMCCAHFLFQLSSLRRAQNCVHWHCFKI